MINQTAADTTDELTELLDQDQLTDIKRKSVSGAVSFLVRTAILQGIGLVSAFVLSAFFSPEDFGIYGFVTQIIGLMIFFSDIGLAAALIQKKNEPKLTEYRTAFTVQQLLSWLIVGAVLLTLKTGMVQAKTGQVGVWVLLSLAISFPLATLKTVSSLRLERKLEFSKLVIPQIFEQLVFHGLLIFLAWQGMGALAYAYAVFARSVIGVVVMWIIEPWQIGLAFNKAALKSLLSFGLKFQLSDFLARVKDQLFFLVLGWFLPLREFGYIQWAKNWSQYPYNLTVQNIMAITFPTFSRLQTNKQALKKAIEKTIFFITLAIFPILVGMSVFITPLTEVVPSYLKWQPAIFSFVLFTLSIGWAALSSPLVNTLNAIGQINSSLKLMALWTVLTWVLTPLGVFYYGFNGVAIAAAAISVTSVLPIIIVEQFVKLDVWDNLWRQLLAAVVMMVAGVMMSSWAATGLVNLLTSMGLLAGVYGLGMVVWGRNKLVVEFRSLKS